MPIPTEQEPSYEEQVELYEVDARAKMNQILGEIGCKLSIDLDVQIDTGQLRYIDDEGVQRVRLGFIQGIPNTDDKLIPPDPSIDRRVVLNADIFGEGRLNINSNPESGFDPNAVIEHEVRGHVCAGDAVYTPEERARIIYSGGEFLHSSTGFTFHVYSPELDAIGSNTELEEGFADAITERRTGFGEASYAPFRDKIERYMAETGVTLDQLEDWHQEGAFLELIAAHAGVLAEEVTIIEFNDFVVEFELI